MILVKMNSSRKYVIGTIISAILIAGILTFPLAFDHQSADARKVKAGKSKIKSKI